VTGWIYTPDGRRIEKGTSEHMEYLGAKPMGPSVFGDEEVFRSPIDGKLYSGKTGMREHNRRHDVVNHRDLVGLPQDIRQAAPPPDRRAIRQAVIESAKRKGYLDGQ